MTQSLYEERRQKNRKTFEDHVPELTQQGRIERLVWMARPKTSIYHIIYLLDGSTLFVKGDCGNAVYEWYGDVRSLEQISTFHLDYFEGKCLASPKGRRFRTWSGDEARAYLEDYWKDQLGEREGKRLDREKERKAEFDHWDGYEHACNQDEWNHWLREHGYEVFGQDFWEFAPTCGEVIDSSCQMHLDGLKIAFEKLEPVTA